MHATNKQSISLHFPSRHPYRLTQIHPHTRTYTRKHAPGHEALREQSSLEKRRRARIPRVHSSAQAVARRNTRERTRGKGISKSLRELLINCGDHSPADHSDHLSLDCSNLIPLLFALILFQTAFSHHHPPPPPAPPHPLSHLCLSSSSTFSIFVSDDFRIGVGPLS